MDDRLFLVLAIGAGMLSVGLMAYALFFWRPPQLAASFRWPRSIRQPEPSRRSSRGFDRLGLCNFPCRLARHSDRCDLHHAVRNIARVFRTAEPNCLDTVTEGESSVPITGCSKRAPVAERPIALPP